MAVRYSALVVLQGCLRYVHHVLNHWDLGTSGLRLRWDRRMLVLPGCSSPFPFALLFLLLLFVSLPIATHHGDRWAPMSPLGVLGCQAGYAYLAD